MAEVIIELELNRRSGVLAAAIAALRHLPLNFSSQQLVDHEKTPRLILTTEGQISRLADVEQAYARTRGVSAVVDVRINGVSLPKLSEVSEGDVEVDQSADARPGVGSSEESGPDDGLNPDPESVDAVDNLAPKDALADSKASQSLTDEFNDDEFARHVLVDVDVDGPIKDPMSSAGPQRRDNQPERSEKQARGGLKGSVLRRRRRLL